MEFNRGHRKKAKIILGMMQHDHELSSTQLLLSSSSSPKKKGGSSEPRGGTSAWEDSITPLTHAGCGQIGR